MVVADGRITTRLAEQNWYATLGKRPQRAGGSRRLCGRRVEQASRNQRSAAADLRRKLDPGRKSLGDVRGGAQMCGLEIVGEGVSEYSDIAGC